MSEQARDEVIRELQVWLLGKPIERWEQADRNELAQMLKAAANMIVELRRQLADEKRWSKVLEHPAERIRALERRAHDLSRYQPDSIWGTLGQSPDWPKWDREFEEKHGR